MTLTHSQQMLPNLMPAARKCTAVHSAKRPLPGCRAMLRKCRSVCTGTGCSEPAPPDSRVRLAGTPPPRSPRDGSAGCWPAASPSTVPSPGPSTSELTVTPLRGAKRCAVGVCGEVCSWGTRVHVCMLTHMKKHTTHTTQYTCMITRADAQACTHARTYRHA